MCDIFIFTFSLAFLLWSVTTQKKHENTSRWGGRFIGALKSAFPTSPIPKGNKSGSTGGAAGAEPTVQAALER